MLFMRCAFESRQEGLTIYPFPGLKVINIRGSNLLALDLITIGSFVSRLSDNNRLLELSMRDYPLDETGLRGILLASIFWRENPNCCVFSDLSTYMNAF